MLVFVRLLPVCDFSFFPPDTTVTEVQLHKVSCDKAVGFFAMVVLFLSLQKDKRSDVTAAE